MIKPEVNEAISSIARLNEIIELGDPPRADFMIMLAGGLAGSCKSIEFGENDTYIVTHAISDTEETLSLSELLDSNIGYAISQKALIFRSYF